MKKLIDIPDDVFSAMEQHKIDSKRSIMGMVQEAIYRWAVHEKLVKVKTMIIYREKIILKQDKSDELPEDITFCDGGKCNV
jgi:hypothetical protein